MQIVRSKLGKGVHYIIAGRYCISRAANGIQVGCEVGSKERITALARLHARKGLIEKWERDEIIEALELFE